MSKIVLPIVLTCVCLLLFRTLPAQKGVKPPPAPIFYANGRLQYTPDSLGNRVPDFSYCGYAAGEKVIPMAPVKVVVPVVTGDATRRIQAAIDYVSNLPLDKDGVRGAVLLQAGEYHVGGSLVLHTGGVVLRGQGAATVIVGEGLDRATLIRIAGKGDKKLKTPVAVADGYVPVNAMAVRVAAGHGLKAGDEVVITRACTAAWIAALGTDHFGGGITSLGWKPGQRELQWVRTVMSVKGDVLELNAPLTAALDQRYGGGTVSALQWPGRISQCGVEGMQLVSTFNKDNEKDESHRWMAITIDDTRDAWVRQVVFRHFAGSAVAVGETVSRVTVEDCMSLLPVSEIGGERRNSFFTAGQQVLFQRCYAEYGMHDFATGFCAAGPTAFVQCESKQPFGFSGGIDSWSAGVLFDVVNVDGGAISLLNRGQDGQGAGWNIANGVLWNCSAARIDCYKPPTANNWALGSWSQFAGDGYWGESNNSIEPRSLYYAQLKERLGAVVDTRVQVMPMESEASSSPTVAVAQQLTAQAVAPAKTLLEFIGDAIRRQPLLTDGAGVRRIDDIGVKPVVTPTLSAPLQLVNGRLVRGTALVAGMRSDEPWWSGSARRYALDKMKPAITRFVPGKTGRGLTDDLGVLTDSMQADHVLALDHNYGLWYERRRDDHERIRRMDGEVWAPFYELPFARSGQGAAWDGLSKYDLTKYNDWYWRRLRQFAELADQKGLLLIHQHYFQHNIIEAGAHYADFPWRPANNINNTGFPEPVPYAGDKRIFMADQFYDTAHPVRRALHKAYIRQCLNNFTDNNGVLHLIGAEYTGPLHFVQFWLDEIAAWERETGKHPLIGLSTTKDVQDAILADPRRTAVVDVIDIRYWHYQQDGSAYAPQGGQQLAPRQHARLLKPKATSAEQVYRSVLEYRTKYPGKAVIYSGDAYDRYGCAVLMAGGSMPSLVLSDGAALQAIATMRPVISEELAGRQWMLHNAQMGYVIQDLAKDKGSVDAVIEAGSYRVAWINALSGVVKYTKESVKGGKSISIQKPDRGSWVLWLKKK
ncbi:DUF6298 domain-containing protein [Paraflavitalea sp. CAU 1676]|uniref:DUF6298 domain-containing protein n=1 Tax=Paraflavitalea sp. CAU 1676 TaxID=3032598 RepID=UPI0023DC4902|nr:DUF6298 domain-containing protein [Paraflavitalea sp. CAU 1676]MDF2190441.1 DUF6298 domain-containing protein [Paraflavitalea sp. CAU 1676]